jgi:SAM-dependent methyltransferase
MARPDRNGFDVIPPEGFQRFMLDRPIGEINTRFSTALGFEKSPIQTAIDTVQGIGSVALLDVGCGTGNTLRTWVDAIASLAPCSPEQISATGISLFDYSTESAYPATRQACKEGRIRYELGNAANMRKIQTNSADVLLAYASLIHSKYPNPWLDEMMRVARPGATMFFITTEKQNDSDAPIMERLYLWEEVGHEVDIEPTDMTTADGHLIRPALCRVMLAGGDTTPVSKYLSPFGTQA